ncbi:phosphodiester glycosidase family protein [Deinococcus peraridilitoris]|nr:phosphodiester glycosidase family protein [Deinococcus peraridilitoris]
MLSASAPGLASPTVVQVQPGDTLTLLSKKYGVSVPRLMQLNHLKSSTIRVGQPLRLRRQAAHARTVAKPAVVKAHTPLRKATRPTRLAKPGKITATVTAARTVAPAQVTVRPGDTLSTLALRHKTTVAQLQRLNKLKSSTITVGQRLRIKAPAPRKPDVNLVRGKVLGVPVVLIEVDMRNPNVFITPVLPRHGLGNGASLKALTLQSGAKALINGGYFHPRSFIPAGDLVVHGRYISTGRVPTAVAITPDNRVAIHPVQAVQFASWRGFETVIASGPHVLRRGVVARHVSQGYRDPAVFGRAARSALGVRGDQQLIFMSSKTLLTTSEVAKIMQRAGAREAILLDGGSSTGIAWQGNVLYAPSRQLSYGIGIYANYRGKRQGR